MREIEFIKHDIFIQKAYVVETWFLTLKENNHKLGELVRHYDNVKNKYEVTINLSDEIPFLPSEIGYINNVLSSFENRYEDLKLYARLNSMTQDVDTTPDFEIEDVSEYARDLIWASRNEGLAAGVGNFSNVQIFDYTDMLISYVSLLEARYKERGWRLGSHPEHENQVLVKRRYPTDDGGYYLNYEVDWWNQKTNDWEYNTWNGDTLMWRECGPHPLKGRVDRDE